MRVIPYFKVKVWSCRAPCIANGRDSLTLFDRLVFLYMNV